MVSFIVLFLPAVLTVWIFEGLTRSDLTLKQWGSFYGVCVLLINTVAMMIMRFLLNWTGIILHDPQVGIDIYMATNHLMLAVPTAIILGVLTALVYKNVKIELEEKKNAEE